MTKFFSWFAIAFAGFLLLIAACSYKLGPSSGLKAAAQSITILPFPNQTAEPRLSPALVSAMRRQIQSEGTFVLDTRRKGDLIVSGNILSFERAGVSFEPDDIITIRDFQLRLTAQIKVIKRRTGEVLFDQSVSGTTLVRGFDDLASAERQALPLLAQSLAQKATDLLVDGDW